MVAMKSLLHLLLLTTFSCYTKKNKISYRRSKNLGNLPKVKPDTLGDSYKKQGLEVPYDDRESLGGEPTGDMNNEGGAEGLGSDMQGYPAGMGAGAEPLGAYDQQQPPNLRLGEGGMPQGPDEDGPSFRGPMGFSKEPPSSFAQGSDSQNGDFFEGRGPMENEPPQSFKPMAPFGRQDNDAENVLGSPQAAGFFNPAETMRESMSNNLGAMDKANVQGDSEVGELVRQSVKNRPDSDYPMDPSVPSSDDPAFSNNRNFGDEGPSEEYRNFKNDFNGNTYEAMKNQPDLMGNRRALRKTKQKSAKKFKGFKTLQHKKSKI